MIQLRSHSDYAVPLSETFTQKFTNYHGDLGSDADGRFHDQPGIMIDLG